MRSGTLVAVAATTVALVAAGCGSSSSNGSSGNGGGSASAGGGGYGGGSAAASGGGGGATSASAASISAKPNGDLNRTILVDSKGDTVYLFEKDDEPDESYCNGACAQVWPAVTTSGMPKSSGAVDASKLGTLKRDDGTTQVTYAGHPLYTYVKDTKPGEATGNEVDEFGAEWYALEPNGAKAESGGESHGGSGKS